jgi:hypothetical protein
MSQQGRPNKVAARYQPAGQQLSTAQPTVKVTVSQTAPKVANVREIWKNDPPQNDEVQYSEQQQPSEQNEARQTPSPVSRDLASPSPKPAGTQKIVVKLPSNAKVVPKVAVKPAQAPVASETDKRVQQLEDALKQKEDELQDAYARLQEQQQLNGELENAINQQNASIEELQAHVNAISNEGANAAQLKTLETVNQKITALAQSVEKQTALLQKSMNSAEVQKQLSQQLDLLKRLEQKGGGGSGDLSQVQQQMKLQFELLKNQQDQVQETLNQQFQQMFNLIVLLQNQQIESETQQKQSAQHTAQMSAEIKQLLTQQQQDLFAQVGAVLSGKGDAINISSQGGDSKQLDSLKQQLATVNDSLNRITSNGKTIESMIDAFTHNLIEQHHHYFKKQFDFMEQQWKQQKQEFHQQQLQAAHMLQEVLRGHGASLPAPVAVEAQPKSVPRPSPSPKPDVVRQQASPQPTHHGADKFEPIQEDSTQSPEQKPVVVEKPVAQRPISANEGKVHSVKNLINQFKQAKSQPAVVDPTPSTKARPPARRNQPAPADDKQAQPAEQPTPVDEQVKPAETEEPKQDEQPQQEQPAEAQPAPVEQSAEQPTEQPVEQPEQPEIEQQQQTAPTPVEQETKTEEPAPATEQPQEQPQQQDGDSDEVPQRPTESPQPDRKTPQPDSEQTGYVKPALRPVSPKQKEPKPVDEPNKNVSFGIGMLKKAKPKEEAPPKEPETKPGLAFGQSLLKKSRRASTFNRSAVRATEKDTPQYKVQFDPAKLPTSLQLDSNNLVVTCLKDNVYGVALIQMPVNITCPPNAIIDKSSLRKMNYFEIQIEKLADPDNLDISVALVNSKVKLSSYLGGSVNSFAFDLTGCTVHNEEEDDYGEDMYEGDRIGMWLELLPKTPNRGNLHFFKNGKPLGAAFKDIDLLGETWNFGVHLFYKDDSIKLLPDAQNPLL